MEKNLELLITQMKTLERYAEELLELRISMIHHKNVLREAWIAAEIEEINELIDRLNRQARYIADEMCGIGYDMIKAYEELEKEQNIE